jgi:hypothetical protein
MTFSFLHATHHRQQPIIIPQIGLSLRVFVPPDATGVALTSIETTNEPGFGPPLHRTGKRKYSTFLRGDTYSRMMRSDFLPASATPFREVVRTRS